MSVKQEKIDFIPTMTPKDEITNFVEFLNIEIGISSRKGMPNSYIIVAQPSKISDLVNKIPICIMSPNIGMMYIRCNEQISQYLISKHNINAYNLDFIDIPVNLKSIRINMVYRHHLSIDNVINFIKFLKQIKINVYDYRNRLIDWK